MNPEVSIIIPSYGKLKLLKKAITSIQEQIFENRELIIINDFEGEENKEQLEEICSYDKRIKLHHNKRNLGIAVSRNKGIKKSSSNICAFLDHDDMRKPEKLELQLNVLKKDKNIGIIGTNAKIIDYEGNITGSLNYHENHDQIVKNALLKTAFLHSSILVHREIYKKIGLYDPRVTMCDDADMYLRILKKYTGKNLPEYLTEYRVYNANTTKTHSKEMRKNTILYHLKSAKGYPYFHRSLLRKLIMYTLPEQAISLLREIKHKIQK